ncbi:MAG: FkbM family methyltransferase [Planctomycetaceae bacterium]|nr:FkbM family methyltransferase [Planctomycetaceae bacterium]
MLKEILNPKHLIRCVLNRFGLEIIKAPQSYGWLVDENIKTILDIGANVGQFAFRMHKILPHAKIYPFEPLQDCYKKLCSKTKNNTKFLCFNYALGSEQGRQLIYHNEFSDSSSLLPMEQLHVDAFPFTKNVKQEYIEIRTLDSVAETLELNKNILIKMDVQGFEDKVILGGEKTISLAKILIVETSFEPLYKGQILFNGMYELLTSKGFTFKGCEDILYHPKTGRILQCNSIFVRQ